MSIQLNDAKLKAISNRSELIKKIKEQLSNIFENLEEVKVSIPLIIEICIAIESQTGVKMKNGKKDLFFEIYSSVFGDVNENDKLYLSEIVDYVVANGAVYKRTLFRRFLRAVSSIFQN
jgi:hypothetical protein